MKGRGPLGLVFAFGVALTACGRAQSDARPQGQMAQPVSAVELPDLSTVSQSVRAQLTERFAALNAAKNAAGTTPEALAGAYGEMGVLLLAASYPEAAERAFLNARTLAPTDSRWSYYLGHVYRSQNQPDKAVAAFIEARRVREGDVPTLVSLAEAHLLAGHPEEALEAVNDAVLREPQNARALYAAGRVNLARRDYRAAVDQLEAALRAAPQADAIHYQLALAYRGAGDTARANEHLQQRGTAEPTLQDPLMEAVNVALDSAVAFDARSRAALARGDWATALAEARRGLELVGDDTARRATLHHRIGTALAQTGDTAGARREFEAAVKASAAFAPGHYSLALMHASAGQVDAALRELSASLNADAGYTPARIARADILRQRGRFAQALDDYSGVLASDQSSAAAQFGAALSLMGLGNHVEARDALTRAIGQHPGDRSLTLALARLLAGAPDATVRNPDRALGLAEPIVQTGATLDGVETVALALARMGRFEEAAGVQREAAAQARRTGETVLATAIDATAALYERRRIPQMLWRAQPVYEP